MSKAISMFLAVVFFLIYFVIFKYIYNSLSLYSTVSQVISGFILVIVMIPLALISTKRLITIIKKNE